MVKMLLDDGSMSHFARAAQCCVSTYALTMRVMDVWATLP
jgi:hypothetical protein